MFVLSRDVSAAKRVIATLLATAMVLWASGAFNVARAANITDVYDLLSDSAPSALSNHTIEFVTPTGVANAADIVITFPPASFDLGSIGETDMDVQVNGVDIDLSTWTIATTATTITFTVDTGSVAAGATTTIEIGDHASFGGAGSNQITNPARDTISPVGNESYEIDISAGAFDSGHTRVVILDTVLVTASVDTSFEFTVYGNGASEPVNGTTTTILSSSTTIPFGTLTAGEIETLSQDLTVQTNAINGFVVTVEADGPLQSSTGADIDTFSNGTTVTNPTTWSSPTNVLTDENTWGHWGVTSEDHSANRTNEFATSTWAGLSTTPVRVFAHTGPADGTTFDKGSTTVGYQIEITPLQEAGDDYSAVLTYIATPTF